MRRKTVFLLFSMYYCQYSGTIDPSTTRLMVTTTGETEHPPDRISPIDGCKIVNLKKQRVALKAVHLALRFSKLRKQAAETMINALGLYPHREIIYKNIDLKVDKETELTVDIRVTNFLISFTKRDIKLLKLENVRERSFEVELQIKIIKVQASVYLTVKRKQEPGILGTCLNFLSKLHGCLTETFKFKISMTLEDVVARMKLDLEYLACTREAPKGCNRLRLFKVLKAYFSSRRKLMKLLLHNVYKFKATSMEFKYNGIKLSDPDLSSIESELMKKYIMQQIHFFKQSESRSEGEGQSSKSAFKQIMLDKIFRRKHAERYIEDHGKYFFRRSCMTRPKVLV